MQGMSSEKPENRFTRGNQRTFLGRSSPQSERMVEFRAKGICKICSKPHGVWVCGDFKQLDISKRWEYAKKFKLCFCCLGEDHIGQYCNRTRVYGQNGCKEVHHQLLHRDQNGSQTNQNGSQTNEIKSNQNEKGDKSTKKEDNLDEKGGSAITKLLIEAEKKLNEQKVEQSDTTMVTETTGNIALRTIPVYIKNCNKNCKSMLCWMMQALKRI